MTPFPWGETNTSPLKSYLEDAARGLEDFVYQASNGAPGEVDLRRGC